MKVILPTSAVEVVYDFGQPDAEGEYTSLNASIPTDDASPRFTRATGAVKIKPSVSRTKKGVTRAHIAVQVPLPLVALGTLCGCSGDDGKRSSSAFVQMAVDLTLPNSEGVLADVGKEFDNESGEPSTVRAANLKAAAIARAILLSFLLHNGGDNPMGGENNTLVFSDGNEGQMNPFGLKEISEVPLFRGVSGVGPVDPAATYMAAVRNGSES